MSNTRKQKDIDAPPKTARRLNAELVQRQLIASTGNVSHAARVLGVTRNTLYEYIHRYPELAIILSDTRESLVDAAESALHSAVIEKQAWAVCFTLKTIGRNRGYVERQEITGGEGEPLLQPIADAIDKIYGSE
ncbi:MAG: helix-turn-helix domain-containing protein [Acidobacteriota bacterium]